LIATFDVPRKRLDAIEETSRRGASSPAAILSHSFSDKAKEKIKRERAMAKPGLGFLPKQNPCAQCGKPIAFPEWVEAEPGRTSYLWRCRACDYSFEAMAFFAYSESDREALAA
jgi:hypothetical protein